MLQNDTPMLRDPAAFTALLHDYKMSKDASRLIKQVPILVMLGPMAAGRNSVMNELEKTGRYTFLVSDTTRPPKVRNGIKEKHGVHYYFRTEEEMLSDLKKGVFLEAELIHNQQVSGTSTRELRRAMAEEKIAMHDYELGGAAALANMSAVVKVIVLVPPTYNEWQRRIKGREIMSKAEYDNRTKSALLILQESLKHSDYSIVVNDSLPSAVEQIRGIVENGYYTKEQHESGTRAVKHLIQALQNNVKKH